MLKLNEQTVRDFMDEEGNVDLEKTMRNQLVAGDLTQLRTEKGEVCIALRDGESHSPLDWQSQSFLMAKLFGFDDRGEFEKALHVEAAKAKESDVSRYIYLFTHRFGKDVHTVSAPLSFVVSRYDALLALQIEYDLNEEEESFKLAQVLSENKKSAIGLSKVSSQLPVLLVDFSTALDKGCLPHMRKGISSSGFTLGVDDLIGEIKGVSSPLGFSAQGAEFELLKNTSEEDLKSRESLLTSLLKTLYYFNDKEYNEMDHALLEDYKNNNHNQDLVLLKEGLIFSVKNMWLASYDISTGELETLILVVHDKKDSRTPKFAL